MFERYRIAVRLNVSQSDGFFVKLELKRCKPQRECRRYLTPSLLRKTKSSKPPTPTTSHNTGSCFQVHEILIQSDRSFQLSSLVSSSPNKYNRPHHCGVFQLVTCGVRGAGGAENLVCTNTFWIPSERSLNFLYTMSSSSNNTRWLTIMRGLVLPS